MQAGSHRCNAEKQRGNKRQKLSLLSQLSPPGILEIEPNISLMYNSTVGKQHLRPRKNISVFCLSVNKFKMSLFEWWLLQ